MNNAGNESGGVTAMDPKQGNSSTTNKNLAKVLPTPTEWTLSFRNKGDCAVFEQPSICTELRHPCPNYPQEMQCGLKSLKCKRLRHPLLPALAGWARSAAGVVVSRFVSERDGSVKELVASKSKGVGNARRRKIAVGTWIRGDGCGCGGSQERQ
jgi:hypothetical protein